MNGLAGIIDFDDLRSEGKGIAIGGDQAVELDLKRSGLVFDAKTDFVNSDNFALEFQSSGENRAITAFRGLDENGANGSTWFGAVGGDRIEETDPKGFACRDVVAGGSGRGVKGKEAGE
jgi:hypothetical protein